MKKKHFSFPLIIVAIILGATLIKHFDVNTLTFEQSWLDVLYLVVFIATLVFLFRKESKQR